MNEVQYFQYLKELVGDDGSGAWGRCSTYGFFQRFRPDGIGLDKVFSAIHNGENYLKRLRGIYAVTSGKECENDAYFIVRSPLASSSAEAKALGCEFLMNLQQLAMTVSDQELLDTLFAIDSIEISPVSTDAYRADEHICVYEIIGDWLGGVRDPWAPISALDEGYYSIACDYWLAEYLRWPSYEHGCNIDIFAPYYELWLRGFSVAIANKVMLIGTMHGDT